MQELSNVQAQGTASEDGIQQKLNRDAMKKERLTQILPYAGIVILTVLFPVKG